MPEDDPEACHEREVTVAGGDGRRIYHLRSIPLHADGGRFLGRTITLRDVTGIRTRERELARNEFLDEFASVVSHDVATPLGVIENKARLIEATGDTDQGPPASDGPGGSETGGVRRATRLGRLDPSVHLARVNAARLISKMCH